MIQPFDRGGDFDKRYDNTYAPAIKGAGLVPYRVDRDPRVVFPNESIKSGIRDAVACFADVTGHNFNVGVEIGIAITLGKILVIASERRKDKIPFDIQDRNIIFYDPGAPNGLTELQQRISEQLKARLGDATTPQQAADAPSVISTGVSLDQYEFSTLVAIGDSNQADPDDFVSVFLIRDALSEKYSHLAVSMALKTLCDKGLVAKEMAEENFQQYATYGLTAGGWKWMHENKNLLSLDKPQRKPTTPFDDMEDIPF